MEKGTTKAMFVLVLVLNAAALGGLFFLFSSVLAKNDHISSVKNEIELETKKAGIEADQSALLEATSDERKKLESYVLSEDKIVEFVERIESMGSWTDTEVTIVSLKSDQAVGAGYLQLQVSAEGTWENVVKYLSMIESLPYKVVITRTSFSKMPEEVVDGKKAKPVPKWKIGIDFSVYKYK